jgi:exosortase/archaeosortase family protein
LKKFTLIYFVTLLIFFLFFYWETTFIASLINDFQVKITSCFTQFTLEEGQMTNNRIMISPTLVLVVDKACNGLIPYYFFLASIIAFPSTIIHKLKWAVIGYVALFVLNVFRIWFISQLVMLEEEHFSLAHDLLGNLFLLLGGLGLFIGFIKTRKH